MAEVSDNSEVIKLLKNLEKRISQIESRFNELQPGKFTEESYETESQDKSSLSLRNEEDEEKLELKIGQFWLAKLGLIAFTIGVVFLLVLPLEGFPESFPSIIGLFTAVILIALSWLWREKHTYISSYLTVGGLITLFISILRLHFFSSNEIIESYFVVVVLLLIVVALTFIIALRKNSMSLTTLGLIFSSVTALISDSEYFIFPLLISLSSLTVYLKFKYKWQGLLISGMILTYIVHLFWYLNNPFVGKELSIVTGHNFNFLFVLIYLAIYSLGSLNQSKESKEEFLNSFISLLNCTLFTGVYAFVLLTSDSDWFNYLIAALTLVSISVIYWIKEESKYSAFYYSMLGFLFLSIAILKILPVPGSYIWLCWQSLLVVSIAISFKSKIIVVANFAIFIVLLIVYLVTTNNFGPGTINFGIVALLTARILNWQKQRLELTTEQMRNAYLLVALFIIPYSLYMAIPTVYVTFSWIGVSLIYYLLSVVLKIKKYRWMALATLFLTVGYIFILGLTSSNSTYKILSFLSVGIVLITTSIVYSRKKSKI